MSNSPVTNINAKKRGTTRFLTGSTPSTCNASSSSRILRAPRSAVIAVPATPASTIASTNGANSRMLARTKNPPKRSSAPNNTRKFAACSPGAPYPKATVLTNSGNQHSFNAKRNWLTNSPPYGYGGLRADMIVLPVKIIMSPTSSSRFLTGKNPRSATLRTKVAASPSCDPGHGSVWHLRQGCQPATVRMHAESQSTRKIERAGTFLPAMGTGLRLGMVGALFAFVVAGCGGGDRQDKNEPSGTFDVQVVRDSFPLSQHIARQSRLRILVRNSGPKTIPNLAVTVKGFNETDPQKGLADSSRPVWIVDRGPKGGDTAYVGTWALGALGPGHSRVFEWRVTPIKAGQFDVRYEVAAGLNGKAVAETSGGDKPAGSFTVRVSGKPADARVDPATGKVVVKEQ